MQLGKKQKILLISFIIIILATTGLLYWHYRNGPTAVPVESKKQEQADFSILQDPRLKNLKPHGQTPIDIGQAGRDNPFEDYNPK